MALSRPTSPRGAEKARNACEAATSVSDHALKRKGELHDGAPVRTARGDAGHPRSCGSAPFPVPDLRQVLAVLIDIKLCGRVKISPGKAGGFRMLAAQSGQSGR